MWNLFLEFLGQKSIAYLNCLNILRIRVHQNYFDSSWTKRSLMAERRITGKPGVVLTTSGPGASNLATGLVTATAEETQFSNFRPVQRTDLLL